MFNPFDNMQAFMRYNGDFASIRRNANAIFKPYSVDYLGYLVAFLHLDFCS